MSDIQKISPDEFAAYVAALFVESAREAVQDSGRFTVALSGGSTPKAIYSLLGSNAYASRVDWSAVHVFWGDERCVPPDDAESNYGMTYGVWLSKVPLPAENVHRMRGEMKPEAAATEYTQELKEVFGSRGWPRFDLVFLGLGEDGHTASLFPGTAAIHEKKQWVIGHYVPKLDMWRLTLTPPVLNAAHTVAFLVSGAGKAEILRRVLTENYQPDLLPAQIVQPEDGTLLWLVDEAAAAQL